MDQIPAVAATADPEASLLLTNIDTAMRELASARDGNDDALLLHRLESALHTYGSVKHLLPKLNLGAQPRILVEAHLSALRACIIHAEELAR